MVIKVLKFIDDEMLGAILIIYIFLSVGSNLSINCKSVEFKRLLFSTQSDGTFGGRWVKFMKMKSYIPETCLRSFLSFFWNSVGLLVDSAISNNGGSTDKYKSKITKIIATHHHIGTDKNNQY
jgi:hypothetical protein